MQLFVRTCVFPKAHCLNWIPAFFLHSTICRPTGLMAFHCSRPEPGLPKQVLISAGALRSTEQQLPASGQTLTFSATSSMSQTPVAKRLPVMHPSGVPISVVSTHGPGHAQRRCFRHMPVLMPVLQALSGATQVNGVLPGRAHDTSGC